MLPLLISAACFLSFLIGACLAYLLPMLIDTVRFLRELSDHEP